MTPLTNARAFQAIYRSLLDRDSGPKAGNLLAFLDSEFLVRRFTELPVEREMVREETIIETQEFEEWISENREQIEKAQITTESWPTDASDNKPNGDLVEWIITCQDGKKYMKRTSVSPKKNGDGAEGYVQDLADRFQLPVEELPR